MYNDLGQSVDYMYRYKREINQTVQIAVDWVLRKAGQVVLNLVSQRSSSRHSVHSCIFKQNNKQTSSLLDSLASGEEKEHSKLGKHPRSALLWQSPWENQVKGAKVTWFIVSNMYVHDCLVSVSRPVEMETMMMGSRVSGRRLTFRQPGNTQVHRGLQRAPYICFFKESCILYVSTIAHSRELRLHPCSDWWCQSSEHFPSLPTSESCYVRPRSLPDR